MQPNFVSPTPPMGSHPSDMTPLSPPPRKFEGLHSFLSTIFILVGAVVVALLLTTFVFQSYEVDGPSMETTLQNRDRLIVLKVPRTISRITNQDYIPKRGDIIVFVKHDLEQFGDIREDKQLIKRVIGLPGDRVVVRDGSVTVYNNENPAGFNPDLNTLYSKGIETTPTDTDTIVGKDEVFVLGDNRLNSLDSRSFGPVKTEDIVGKLALRVFPLNQAKTF
jgi:signal peptidase I